MTIFLDKTNKQLIACNGTKDSRRLLDLKDDEFIKIVTVYTYRANRRDISINYELFDIPEENQQILTPTEYIKKHNIVFE